MRIFIKQDSGKLTLEVPEDATIADVAMLVYQKRRASLENLNIADYTKSIRFVYAGTPLDFGKKLSDYAIVNDSVLHEVFKCRSSAILSEDPTPKPPVQAPYPSRQSSMLLALGILGLIVASLLMLSAFSAIALGIAASVLCIGVCVSVGRRFLNSRQHTHAELPYTTPWQNIYRGLGIHPNAEQPVVEARPESFPLPPPPSTDAAAAPLPLPTSPSPTRA